MACHQQGMLHRLAAHGLVLVGVFSFGIAGLATEPTSGITTVPQAGFNLVVSELMSPTYAVLKLATPNHGWFAGTFTQLPIGQPVTFGLSMDGNDGVEPANVVKWKGLRPVMTYADPSQYMSYIGYTKTPDGHWIADDPFRSLANHDAGAGNVPVQQVMPPELAASFLSSDGATWYPWREMQQAQTITGINIFRTTDTFSSSTATVAMRVPYSYQYQQTFLERLQAAKSPGVTIDTVGQTPGGHALTIIRLEPPDPTVARQDRPTLLIYAREHATEHDSSWVVEGMLDWLMSEAPAAVAARQQNDWLLIPLLDPDEAVKARHCSADLYTAVDPIRPEALAYATYLVNWVDAGHRIELAVNLHNVECAEGQNLFAPLTNTRRQELTVTCQQQLFNAAQQAGFSVGRPQGWMYGLQSKRLAGWCWLSFGSFDLVLEVNSRAPISRLNVPRLRTLGSIIAASLTQFIDSTDFLPIRQEMTRRLAERQTQRAEWWRQENRSPQTRNTYDLLVLGY